MGPKLSPSAETTFLLVGNNLSALTHIMWISHDFDVANLPQYRNDNTLPHIVHFRNEIQETLQK